jgi:hypothetical protein
MAGWELVHTAGGGDCLFHACAAALTEISGVAVTATHLRRLVAQSITSPTESVLSTLSTWMELVDAGMAEDVPQATCVHKQFLAQGRKLTRADLFRVAQAMMDPGIYWGDEYAIDVLQRTFNCGILVYDRRMVRHGHDAPTQAKFYIPLLYHREHYDLLRYQGRSTLTSIPQ